MKVEFKVKIRLKQGKPFFKLQQNIGVLCILLLFFSIQNMLGQSDCIKALSDAHLAFIEGKYEQVIKLLENNIKQCDYNESDKEQATKLLSSAYFNLNEVELANELVLDLLKENPTYQVQTTTDPEPFVDLIDNYILYPRLKTGLSAGACKPFIETLKSYSVIQDIDYTSNYSTEAFFAYSLNIQYLINNKFSFVLSPVYTSIVFHEETDYTDYLNIEYSEITNIVRIPLTLNYKIYSVKDVAFSVLAGVYGSIAEGTGSSLVYQATDYGEFDAKEFENIERKKFNAGIQTGLCVEYTKNRLCYSAQIKYGRDFNLYNIEGANYSNTNLLYDYYYSSDDIRLQHLDFQIGVSYILLYRIKDKYRTK